MPFLRARLMHCTLGRALGSETSLCGSLFPSVGYGVSIKPFMSCDLAHSTLNVFELSV